MVAPLAIYAGISAVSLFLSAYQDFQSKKVSDYASSYQMAYNRDIERFYNDYTRKTGQRVKYPYKSGAIPDYSGYYKSRYSSDTAYYRTGQRALGLGAFYAGRYQRNPPYNGSPNGMYA